MWAHERVLVSVEPGAVVADGVPAAHRAHLNKGRFTREMLVSIAYVKFDQGLQVNRNLNSSLLLDDEGYKVHNMLCILHCVVWNICILK